ncbi:chaperonin 10-like protein [Flammula alnicola]|nr:chaperonin 10-like protein [Flammula alnicola]
MPICSALTHTHVLIFSIISPTSSAMPSTQKALLLEKKFGNFVLGEIAVPKAGPGEILIKVIATSLNHIDWKIQKYGVFVENFPAVLGGDLAGDVEELGEGVTDFMKGDRVFVRGQLNNETDSFQQYALALASTVAKIPANISYDQASTFPVALSAAYVGLYNQNPHGLGFAPPTSPATQGKYAGTPIVILGGASSVGQNIIQLAKLSGLSLIITTASLKHTDYLKSLGATAVLDRNLSSSALTTEISKITSTSIKFVYDSISADSTQKIGLDILAPGGQLVVDSHPTAKPVQDKTIIRVVSMLRLPQNIELLETFYHDTVSGFLEKGLLKPNNIEVLPNGLGGIPDGLARMEADKVSALKLVAHPQETA